MRDQVFAAEKVGELVEKLTREILKDYADMADVVLIGIRTGGVHLARRLQRLFAEYTSRKLPLGVLDINLYRDDFDRGNRHPEVRRSEIDFQLEGKTVILVDDVLFTGRTVRAALEAIQDYGRPAAVRLAVLVDRGNRELPIEPTYTGATLETESSERIKVVFSESGQEDQVERINLQ